jgi:glycosyltransferase involved in cell wall biosynthesis
VPWVDAADFRGAWYAPRLQLKIGARRAGEVSETDTAEDGKTLERKRLVSVVTPCYNEEDVIREFARRVKEIFQEPNRYRYEHIFIDNSSTDRTVDILREIAATDPNVKIIVNTTNFGVFRSPMHAFFQASGAAIIPMAADLQDPPELIPVFLKRWEEGFKIVAGVKKQSRESLLMGFARRSFYRLIDFLSEYKQIRNFTGFGLYDRAVMDLIRSTGDHFPYLRGLVCEMGYPIAKVEYVRPGRSRGISKNSLYDLYCQAMNGIVNQSKFPLRLATFVGFIMAFFSALVAFGYLIYKLLFWESFRVGLAPMVIGLFFFASVQLIFLGIIGEYIGAMHGRLFQKWLVIEKERINFGEESLVRPLPEDTRLRPGQHHSGDGDQQPDS